MRRSIIILTLLVGTLFCCATHLQSQTAPAATNQTIVPDLPGGIADVVKLVKAKLPEPVIINKIKSDNTAYNLTTDQLIYLNSIGASEAVIQALQTKPATAPPSANTVAAPAPQSAQPTSLGAEPPPLEPPPVEAAPAAKSEDPASIINRAIAATGGRDALARFNAVKSVWKYRATDEKGRPIAIESEETMEYPDKLLVDRTITTLQNSEANIGPVAFHFNKKPHQQILCVTASTNWLVDKSLLGAFKSITPAGVDNLKKAIYLNNLARLLPEIDEHPALALLSANDEGPTNSWAISIKSKGQPDAVLYFDKTTDLLSGAEIVGEQTGQSELCLLFANYSESSGIKYPGSVKTKLNGKVVSTGKATSVTPMEEIPADTFERPAR